MKTIALSIAIVLLGLKLFAQRNEYSSDNNAIPFIKGFRFETENDFIFPINNRDKNYTGQFRIEVFVRRIFDKGLPVPFVRNIKTPQNNLQSFFIHGMAYTPAREYFSSVAPVTTDRPFASYLCGGFQRTSWWEDTTSLLKLSVTTELTLGEIGSEAPGKFQNFLHEYLAVSSKPVLGWDNQIGYPGRFAFYYRVHGVWIPQKKIKKINLGIRYDLMPIGYFMRYEKIGVFISNMSVSGLSQTSDLPSFKQADHFRKRDPAKPNKAEFGWEFVPSIKLVQWNSMLAGHPIEDESVYKIPEENVYKFVPEASFRIKIMIPRTRDGRTFTIFYNANVRGKEFSGGDHVHFWGTLGLQTMKD